MRVESAGWYGIPSAPKNFLRRPRLLERLEQAASLPLVLVSAPAGSGKTALVAEWAASCSPSKRPEWITFECGDTDFWSTVLQALLRMGVAVPFQSVPAHTISLDRPQLTTLASSIAEHPRRVVLVLDGYDTTSAAVGADLDFLLRHSGHRLQLVLVTRTDPVLPLYRYRLEDTLAEIRMSDLAFTDAEANDLLSAHGVSLSTESVHALNDRTAGWVAGLRFATRILENSEDPDLAAAEIVGDTGNIAEYLMGEVLAAQTPEVRTLLLNTSVPDTLQPGLIEELGGPTAARTLALLTKANAFVEPVPQHPGCYRYHPFLRDLLRAELMYESPDRMERLQRTAAEWFSRAGLLTASVAHYSTIDAWPEASGHVVEELAVGELLVNGGGVLANKLKAMPEGDDDPANCIVRAALALAEGDTNRYNDEMTKMAADAENGDDAPATALSLAKAILQAVRARFSSDPRVAMDLATVAEQALTEQRGSSCADTHPELLALVCASKGIATLRQGQLGEALDLFTAGAEAAAQHGSESLLVECLGYRALIACLRGRLVEARAVATRAVAIADEAGIQANDRPAAAQTALAWVDVEQVQLLKAADQVHLAEASGFMLGDPVPHTLLSLVRCRLQMARGDVTGALATIDQAKASSPDEHGWLGDRLRLEAARLRIVRAETEVAVLELEGLQERYPAEVALLTAQIRLAAGDVDAAGKALSHALAHGTPVGVQVAGWLVEARRQLQQGSSSKARSALDTSMKLASREGLRRPFLDAPACVSQLLATTPIGADTGLLHIPRQRTPAKAASRSAKHSVAQVTSDMPVVERLTDKELEVLGHLANLLNTEEIASAMFVSVNTTRTHVRSILRKLGVPRRNAAVRRARELQLLSR